MPDITINGIHVLDSIPDGDFNSARKLYDDLLPYAAAYKPTLNVTYARSVGASQFREELAKAAGRAKAADERPALHIECHANLEGIQLADGSRIEWEALLPDFIALNIATRLNLLVTVSACEGGALGRMLRIGNRAPFAGLIGPTTAVTGHQLLESYAAFYLTLLETKSPSAAIQRLMESSIGPSMWRTTCDQLFEEIWAGYRRSFSMEPELSHRAARLRAKLLDIGKEHSLDECRAQLLALDLSEYPRARQMFYMADIYPEHAKRFGLE
jgi:hypothetical protein